MFMFSIIVLKIIVMTKLLVIVMIKKFIIITNIFNTKNKFLMNFSLYLLVGKIFQLIKIEGFQVDEELLGYMRLQ